jgi:membrane associated rhomboid family serine protease
MGIYDRDYYRREGPSFLSSWVERGTACKWLIGANVICFILQIVTRAPARVELPDGRSVPLPFIMHEPFTDALLLNVHQVLQGEVWRLLTAGFLHSVENPFHIIFNMLVLWWFGRQVEDELGPREFVTFYLVSIVGASLAYVAGAQLGIQRGNALGASGGVTAVLVLCALYHPRMVVYLFFILPVPIWGVVVFMVAKDSFDMLRRAENGIGYTAHLGGAAFALVYYQWGGRLTRLWSGLSWPKRRPALRIYHEEDDSAVRAHWAAPAATPSGTHSEHLEAEVDAILEKISRTGKESLTDREREVLLRASEAIKRRRT